MESVKEVSDDYNEKITATAHTMHLAKSQLMQDAIDFMKKNNITYSDDVMKITPKEIKNFMNKVLNSVTTYKGN